MSVSTTSAGVIRIGDGLTTIFSFSFEARLASEIKVSNILSTVLDPVLTGFTVTLNPTGEGGIVKFDVAPADELEFYIFRETALTQLVSVSSQQKYDPEVVEGVWDKMTFQIQELAEQTARAVKVVPGQTGDELLAAIAAAELSASASATAAATEADNAEDAAAAAALSAAAAATFNPALYQLIETRAIVTAGTNAQGQGPLTADQNVVTVTAANPSGVTLPVAVAGRRISIVNRGTNPINIYPASGAAIGALAVNTPTLLAVGRTVDFFARSATQWEGQLSQPAALNLDALAGLSFVQGDIFYATAANTLARLPKGTALQKLRMNAGASAPEWVDSKVSYSAISLNGLTGVTTPTFANDFDELDIFIDGVSLSGTDNIILQIGSGGVLQTTGYDSQSSNFTTNFGSGISNGYCLIAGTAALAMDYNINLKLQPGGNRWVLEATARYRGNASFVVACGTVTLSGALDILRLQTSGANTFDAGSLVYIGRRG